MSRSSDSHYLRRDIKEAMEAMFDRKRAVDKLLGQLTNEVDQFVKSKSLGSRDDAVLALQSTFKCIGFRTFYKGSRTWTSWNDMVYDIWKTFTAADLDDLLTIKRKRKEYSLDLWLRIMQINAALPKSDQLTAEKDFKQLFVRAHERKDRKKLEGLSFPPGDLGYASSKVTIEQLLKKAGRKLDGKSRYSNDSETESSDSSSSDTTGSSTMTSSDDSAKKRKSKKKIKRSSTKRRQPLPHIAALVSATNATVALLKRSLPEPVAAKPQKDYDADKFQQLRNEIAHLKRAVDRLAESRSDFKENPSNAEGLLQASFAAHRLNRKSSGGPRGHNNAPATSRPQDAPMSWAEATQILRAIRDQQKHICCNCHKPAENNCHGLVRPVVMANGQMQSASTVNDSARGPPTF
ncbi:hypothetical protein HDU86_007310 [Geranomyces michiganensis]|nr:hypothetical protein HDU86_007310 [Geranomyces michiganensis]